MRWVSWARTMLNGALVREEQSEHACRQQCAQVPAQVDPALKRLNPSGQIIVCRRPIQTDARVVNWIDAPSFSAYYRCCYRGASGSRPDPHPYKPAQGMENRVTRYRPRKELLGQPWDLPTLQQLIRQLVIHHDGANSSAECFHILHDERGLSAHFLIDTDGTIYQTLDLADVAFHAQFVNGMSIGVELCNRGLVALGCSPAHRQKREPRTATIHGQTYRMWSFTDAQYASLSQLVAALGRIFPRLPLCFPRSGGPIFGKLAEPQRYSGLLGHYHVSAQKWDPGCFDFPRLLAMLSERRQFALGGSPGPGPATRPLDLLQAEAENPHGGFFPVGPCGAELVWHGGVHLALPARAAVPALLAGQVVAARLNRRDGAFGSTCFVLTRHEVSQVGRRHVFFILYYHLAPALSDEELPAWRRRPAERAASSPPSALDVAFPDVDVLAGEVLGRVGLAGPQGAHAPQLHLQVFAAEEIAQALFPGRFQTREPAPDCDGAGLACLDEEIRSLVRAGASRPPQEPLSRAQLIGATQRLRRTAVRFPSEWWLRDAREHDRALRSIAAYRSATPATRAAVYCEQARPAAWLDVKVARRLGLPESPLLWHYHPIEFVSALVSREGPQQNAADVGTATEDARATGGLAEDGSKADTGYASDEDLAEWEVGNGVELTTEELASGYPLHWLR